MTFKFLPVAGVCSIVFCIFFHGCMTLSNQYQKDEYERTMFDYDTAMQLSDFNRACKFLDPAVLTRDACLACYENLKIIEYEVQDITISEDEQEVTQDIVVDYHFHDRVVVKKIQFEQTWQYKEEARIWLLQSDPPKFE